MNNNNACCGGKYVLVVDKDSVLSEGIVWIIGEYITLLQFLGLFILRVCFSEQVDFFVVLTGSLFPPFCSFRMLLYFVGMRCH